MLFAISLIGVGAWWFIQMLLAPELFPVRKNIFFSFTKLGTIVAGIGLLKMKKWGIYIYAIMFLVTTVSIFSSSPTQTIYGQIPLMILVVSLVIAISLLALMFIKYWKKFS